MLRAGFLIVMLLALAGCATAPGRAWVERGYDAACPPDPRYAAAAATNAAGLDNLAFAPFGAAETGWRLYGPKVGMEIGSACAPDSQAFAERLARWQKKRGLVAHGGMTPETFELMKTAWQAERPFLAVRAQGLCPAAPPGETLDHAPEDEAVMGKPILMTPATHRALEALRAQARRDLKLPPGGALLLAFSAFRAPAYDDERCLRERNCDGVVRAPCSAHRTGTALDLSLGAAPGHDLDTSAAPNRLYQTSTPAYRWLVRNAAKYGFVNYVFEPWHWEYVTPGGAGR